jgi:hypothetical protein
MSLKAFHLFFIGASILLALGVGAWGLRTYALAGGGSGHLLLGLAGLVGGFVLVLYGARVRQKLKGLDAEGKP